MKGIKHCAECANYSMKLHKCIAGAVDEGKAQDPFYADCPLPDVVEFVHCKDCEFWGRYQGVGDSPNGFCFCYNETIGGYDFCAYGVRRENAVD